MVLGIDVGGTNTDACLIDRDRVVDCIIVPTEHEQLMISIMTAVEKVLYSADVSRIEELHLSTTLSTNLLVESKEEATGVIVSAGPGIHPAHYYIGEYFEIVDGALDEDQIIGVMRSFAEAGINVFSAVAKFSPRNPDHEHTIARLSDGYCDFITVGHTLSGSLNFPRRIYTAYFNSSVWRRYNAFIEAIKRSMDEFGMNIPVRIVKADGGTMPIEYSGRYPVQTILSGPAASVMGSLGLNRVDEDAIILDIGGTTTDMAVFARGVPLLERDGATIAGKPTLVRSVKTASIGIGGDSLIKTDGETVSVGPQREGPACCFGGALPTLMDAFVFSGLSGEGDTRRSIQCIIRLAEENRMDPAALCERAMDSAMDTLVSGIETMLDELNQRPVYTVYEVLHPHPIKPETVILLGGPAELFAIPLGKQLTQNIIVSPFHATANAVGAALTKATFGIELFADTQKRWFFVPELGVSSSLSLPYSLEEAKEDAKQLLTDFIKEEGFASEEDSIEITEYSSFPMMDWMSRVGDNIRVRAQLHPRLSSHITVEEG